MSNRRTKIEPLTSLSFERMRPKAEQVPGSLPRCFWAVEPSGEYDRDCRIGHGLAREAIGELQRTGLNPLLGWIALDMVRSNDLAHRGLIIGFMSEVSNYLVRAPAVPTTVDPSSIGLHIMRAVHLFDLKGRDDIAAYVRESVAPLVVSDQEIADAAAHALDLIDSQRRSEAQEDAA